AQSWGEGLDAGVEASVRAALDQLAPLVASITAIDLPLLEASIPAYYLVATAEASANLSRFDGVRYGARDEHAGTLDAMYSGTRGRGFGTEVKRRILLGTHALSSGYYDAYYLRAMKVRRKIADDFARAFETCDVIALPATPTPAFRIGEQIDDPLTMYRNDLYTIAANLAGVPAISIPCGLHGDGLPLGVQLMAPRFQEAKLLRVASHWEAKLGTLGRPPRVRAAGGDSR
ncbi:MAG: Asp-tRNA(Asn)/Glu-tRNA(Gln) amidotransferase GatCAB subunit A, partial [Gemmatimonadetes bacterium]|nr:Asp-tRNA(Asn)/Glu-tRNA(Gln) amidotransferase GatCAB subunit A [Gemmatimonadota bacterium]